MERKRNQEPGVQDHAVHMLKALLAAYIVTAVLLLLLTCLLYKLNLDEGKVSIGISAVYVISTFTGGFLIGKWNRVRKFLWGLAEGILYFALLLVISIAVYHSLQDGGANVLTTFLLCAGGGMLGGMLA